MYRRFEEGMRKAETAFVSVGLMLLIFTVFAAAVLRFFGVDMSISTDLAQLTFAWITFIGADLAMRQDRHMGVDLLTGKLPVAARNFLRLFNYCLAFAFLVYCVYYGVNLCIVNKARKYQTLYISYSYATASCPVGCALMSITAIKRVVECIQRFAHHDYSAYKKEAKA